MIEKAHLVRARWAFFHAARRIGGRPLPPVLCSAEGPTRLGQVLLRDHAERHARVRGSFPFAIQSLKNQRRPEERELVLARDAKPVDVREVLGLEILESKPVDLVPPVRNVDPAVVALRSVVMRSVVTSAVRCVANDVRNEPMRLLRASRLVRRACCAGVRCWTLLSWPISPSVSCAWRW